MPTPPPPEFAKLAKALADAFGAPIEGKEAVGFLTLFTRGGLEQGEVLSNLEEEEAVQLASEYLHSRVGMGAAKMSAFLERARILAFIEQLKHIAESEEPGAFIKGDLEDLPPGALGVMVGTAIATLERITKALVEGEHSKIEIEVHTARKATVQ